VLQEAYLRAYAHLDDFAGLSSFSTWLTRIAVHEALWRARRAELQPIASGDVLELEFGTRQDDPEVRASGRQILKLVERAVNELPEAWREVFELRCIDGLSVAETADVLCLSEEAVKMRCFRAYERLREELHGEWSAPRRRKLEAVA
jgi:RNA polymerase sigma-70 factor (ECF subfamily)